MSTKSLGQVAYEGYFKFANGKSLVSGAPLPSWEAQAEPVRQAWEAAATEVNNELLAQAMQSLTPPRPEPRSGCVLIPQPGLQPGPYSERSGFPSAEIGRCKK